jgi:hypothetical protein
MRSINLGLINLIICDELKNSYFNNNTLNESRKNVTELFNIVKESPLLSLEFKVYNNIENKNIDNDACAIRYIDNNIKLFETYTLDDFDTEHKKLEKFLTNDLSDLNENKIYLYDSIYDLIKESLSLSDDIDVDQVHESFTFVLNHIKSNKQIIDESKKVAVVSDDVINIAINKFNEKYSNSLNENEFQIFRKLIKSNDDEKKELFESLKIENLNILNEITDDTYKDKTDMAINKISEMKFNTETVNEDIINLFELKNDLN